MHAHRILCLCQGAVVGVPGTPLGGVGHQAAVPADPVCQEILRLRHQGSTSAPGGGCCEHSSPAARALPGVALSSV